MERIRKELCNTSIPLIALTVYTGRDEKRMALAAGANEFVNKPISQANLRKLLLKYLRVGFEKDVIA